MTTNTKKTVLFSLLTFIAVSSFSSFIFYEIFKQSKNLEEQKNILAENKNKEIEFFGIQRLLRETEVERSVLAESFFYDQNDTVIFLDSLDKLAADFNLILEINSLEKTEDEDKKQVTKISFSFEGQKDKVLAFSELLENIPYHSFLENLNLKQSDNDIWKGKVSLVVTMRSL